MNEREKLREVVRRELKKRSKKQIDFAADNFLDHDDLRVQLTRNAFSAHVLAAISGFLGVSSISLLERKYDFDKIEKRKDETVSPVQIVEERISRSLKKQKKDELVVNLKTLYERLDKKDLVVISSLNEPPLECSYEGWNELGDHYTDAIRRGAVFLYIRPNENVLDRNPKKFRRAFFGGGTPEEEVLELQSNVIRAGIKKNAANEQIRLSPTDFSPFWAIGMRFGFYSILERNKTRDTALFARFPFGGPHSRDSLILVGSEQMRQAFHGYLTEHFERPENKLTDLRSRLKDG